MSAARPERFSIAILAIGGQGGGVLADWLISVAEAGGWLAQATSVPGVAQRTGATIYYLELVRPDAGTPGEPVLALMPTAGDVDLVVAAELMEAGRALQRGLVNPARTTLIASSHRAYAIAEKSALGDGRADADKVHAAASALARRYIYFDMDELAQRNASVISAVLLGAIAAAGVLPFARADFAAAISGGAVGGQASLHAFEAGYARAAQLGHEADVGAPTPAPSPAAGETGELSQRIRAQFPQPAHEFLRLGVQRLVDYMDADYAREYLQRMAKLAALDRRPEHAARLTRLAARYLALRMSYEDTIRVADLKTRGARFERFRAEVRAEAGQIVHVTEYLHPRLEEIADTLPAKLGRTLLRPSWLSAWLRRRCTRGRLLRTSTLRGFLVLYALGRLRRYRRRTLRHAHEMEQIAAWLAQVESRAPQDYEHACAIIECARVLKGYGETRARAERSFAMLMAASRSLAGAPDAGARLRRLIEAALADEDGCALRTAAQELTPAAQAVL